MNTGPGNNPYRNRMFSASSKASPVNADIAVAIQKVRDGLQQNKSKFEQLIAMLARTTQRNPLNDKYFQKISQADERIAREVLQSTPVADTDVESQSPSAPGPRSGG